MKPDPGEVVVLTWEEYFSPEVIADFESSHGIAVKFRYFTNLEELEDLITSQPDQFDVVVADGSTLANLVELQMLLPINRERLTEFQNLDSKYLGLDFDPQNQYTVPYLWGTMVVAYRSDLIPEPRKSWSVLWDEKYVDRVLMLDDPLDSFAVSLLTLGHGVNSEDPIQLGEATGHLLNQVRTVGAEFLDIIEIRERLLDGTAWIAAAYASDAAMMAEENENIAFFAPGEGSPLWLDSFAIPREAPNEENAHRFLNYLCRAEVAAESSNYLWCATPNRAAVPLLSEELFAEETVYPGDELLAKSEFFTQPGAERGRLVNRGMKLVNDLGIARRNGESERLVSEESEKSAEVEDSNDENP